MDLLGVLRACLRRWYVFLPIIVLTAWLGRDQYRQAEPQYTSTATVVIAPSAELVYNRGRQAESGLVVTSPFNGGEGPRVLAGLTVRALNTGTVRQQLLPDGGAALSASRDVQQDATVVNIQVVAADAETGVAAVQAVLAGVNDVVARVQYDAGAPEGQLYNAVPGGPVDPPLVAYPDRVRGVVAIALAGVLLSVVLSVLAQSLMAGRRRKDQRALKAEVSRAPRQPVVRETAGEPGRAAQRWRSSRPARPGKRTPGRRSHAAGAEPDDALRDEVDLREHHASTSGR